MNNIHIVSCPRSGNWNTLYETIDNILKSNILDFNIHVWAGMEIKDVQPICNNNIILHVNIDPPKNHNIFNGLLNYKRAMRAACLDDISIIIEDDIDVYFNWVDISVKALNLLDDNALLSMHHFYENSKKFIDTNLDIDNISIFKLSNNSGVTGAQGYISRGDNWKRILHLIELPEYSKIVKIQDVIFLKTWCDNYYVLDPCIVKHRENVISTWSLRKMLTKNCIF